MQGVVKWFNATKGFGFIAPDGGGTDVFLHIVALNGLRIDEGDVIGFDLQDGRKGKEAVNVSMVTKNPNPPMRRSFIARTDHSLIHKLKLNHPKLLTPIPKIEIEQIIGKDNELVLIEKAYEENRKVAITGIGGSGKTTLCTIFIKKNIESFEHIVWLDCTNGIETAFIENQFLKSNLFLEDYLDTVTNGDVINALNEFKGNNIAFFDNHSGVPDNLSSILEENWSIFIISRNEINNFFNLKIESLGLEEAQKIFYSYYHKEKNDYLLTEIVKRTESNRLALELLAKIGQEDDLSLNDLVKYAKVKFMSHILDTIELNKGEINSLFAISIFPRHETTLNDFRIVYKNLFKELINKSIIDSLTRKGLIFRTDKQVLKTHPLVGYSLLEKYYINLDTRKKSKKRKKFLTQKYSLLIAEGKIKECIHLLKIDIKAEKPDFFNEIILISSRYSSLQDTIIKGIISNADAALLNNQISNSLLMLLDKIDEEEVSMYINNELKEDSKIKIFFSYSRKDVEYRNEIEKQLAVLKKNNLIETWHDLNIQAGKEWESEIITNITGSDIILILLSADFLNSDYCNKELEIAFNLHIQQKAIIIPVILRPCLWKESVLKILNAIPTGGEPVTKWKNQDEAFADIADRIKECVVGINQNPSAAKKRVVPNNEIVEELNENQLVKNFEIEDKSVGRGGFPPIGDRNSFNRVPRGHREDDYSDEA